MASTPDSGPANLPAVNVAAAVDIARDAKRAEVLAVSVEEKAKGNRSALGRVFEDLLALARMLRSYARRHYTQVPWKSMALIAATLVYFLAPVDLVPDFLFGGFADDVALLLAVLRQVKEDVDAYKSWERERAGADTQ